MSGGEMEKLRTGCLKVRCSKSCYLCDLELVDLFDNWSFRTGLLSGFSFSSSWTVAKILGSAHRSAQASFPSRKSILESLLGRISSLGNSSKIELNFRREPIRLAAGEVLKAYRYEHLLSTRQETALIMFMYMTLPSLIFSTGQDIGRFVPCKALKSDKNFSFAFSSSQNKSIKPNHWVFSLRQPFPPAALLASFAQWQNWRRADDKLNP